MLHLQRFTFNPLQENTYVLYHTNGDCVIIDPGCYEEDEKEALANFIEHKNLTVSKLLNTHCHVDHVLGNSFVKERYQVKLHIHELDEPVLRSVKVYAPHYGFFQYEESEPDVFLSEGNTIQVGGVDLHILFVPGHAPGHIAFYQPEQKFLIAGDVLFYNSIGRTDLPGGNYNTLISSIHQKLFILPEDVTVYPGHGPETTIGFEKRTNPFCSIA
jgi:hydroxyacylglutathione hydrolase